MTEVVENEEIDRSGESGAASSGSGVSRGTEARNASGGSQPDLQPVQESGAGSEVQRIPDGNPHSNPVQETGLPEVSAEVTFEEQIAEKADLCCRAGRRADFRCTEIFSSEIMKEKG